MEGLATEDDPTAEKEENAENLRRMRPPNRKKFEEEVDSLMRTIRELEAKNKSLSHRPDDNLQGELKAIKAEIRATIERRKKIDSDLRNLNQHIEKQQAALSKIQSTLQYRSESKIDEAIRRLDYQLKTRNFKLSEEKKIVSEIDCLRRSRKNVGEYLTIKKEINDNRDRQRRMREERDHYYKAVKPLKNKEDELRRLSESHRSQIIENKKELDDLYEQKRHITAEFRKQEREYFEQRDDSRRKQREDQARKREEERRAHLEAKQRARAEIEANRIPHEEEIIACDLLISYLKRYCQQPEQPNSSTENQDTQTKTTHPTDPTDDSEGTYILKKKDTITVAVTRGKSNKKSKRDRTKSLQNKPVIHTLDILDQFSSLNLRAPAIVLEVPVSIEQLEQRKSYYESMAAESAEESPSRCEAGLSLEDETRAGSATEMNDQVLNSPNVEHHNIKETCEEKIPQEKKEEGEDASVDVDNENSDTGSRYTKDTEQNEKIKSPTQVSDSQSEKREIVSPEIEKTIPNDLVDLVEKENNVTKSTQINSLDKEEASELKKRLKDKDLNHLNSLLDKISTQESELKNGEIIETSLS